MTAIRWSWHTSSLGDVLIAHSETGVCSVAFGDDPASLLADLRQRFPDAVLGEDDGSAWSAVIGRKIETPAVDMAIPLDLRGTVFQTRVWAELQRIPPGATATYTQIATRIGQPTAARAVARACAANPVAVLVPCHRVVRGDGSLSGYRWGVARKAELLRREGAGPLALRPAVACPSNPGRTSHNRRIRNRIPHRGKA